MRLLDKKIVVAQVAQERKNQIDDGLKLAKKIDALRQTHAEEEERLETFRREMVAEVQREIAAAISEREVLQVANERLREERFALQAPLDLKEERTKNLQLKSENEVWSERLTEVQLSQMALQGEIAIRFDEISSKEADISAKDALIERTLTEAEAKFTQASDIKDRAERDAEKMLADARIAENHVRVREEDATNREVYLSKREGEAQAHEVDLANREKKLKRNQEVFIKAQNYIKNKK